LDRFGDEVFNEIFTRSIAQCQKSGLIEGKMWHVDATTIRADLDKHQVNKPDSADREARFGRFADGSFQPGYKQQTVVDDRRGVIVGLSVTAANEADDKSLLPLVDCVGESFGSVPEVVCADGAYASGDNAAACEDRQVRLVSPPQPVPKNQAGHFAIDQFVYDEAADEFTCPAGERLRSVQKAGQPGHKRKYRGSPEICRGCVLRSRCTKQAVRSLTVGSNHGALRRLRADSQTESFRQLYRRRAPVIEGIFAEAKQWHGLRRAWRRGLAKMRLQCLLIAAVLNFKRLVAAGCRFLPWKYLQHAVPKVLGRLWEILRSIADTLSTADHRAGVPHLAA
jgi:hypothetical protein